MTMTVPPTRTVPVAAGCIVHGLRGHQYYGAGLVVIPLGSFPLAGVMMLPHHYHRRRRGRPANIDNYLRVG